VIEGRLLEEILMKRVYSWSLC